MEKRRILLIGGNFYPEPIGIGKYNGEMINAFAAKGFQCTVITTYPYYPYWKVQAPFAHRWLWFQREVRCLQENGSDPVNIYRCPQYVPASPTGMKRMILDFSFFCSSALILFKLFFYRKYDCVITVVPSFQLGLLGYLYKVVKGSKFLYHIQDLQIDAARDLQMIKSKRLLGLLFKVEKFILKKADVVSSISPGMIQKIKTKFNRNVVMFPNWVDTNMYYPIKDNATIKENFGFNSSDKIVLYSGAIGEKQGLETLIQAASFFRDIEDIVFVICGTGPYKEKLEQLSKELQLKNVSFQQLHIHKEFNQFLNIADLHLVLQKNNAADLVMPSKLTTILAVGGVSVVTACKDSFLYQEISSNNIGYAIEPENQEILNSTIRNALYSDKAAISDRARAYAENHLSSNRILSDFASYLS